MARVAARRPQRDDRRGRDEVPRDRACGYRSRERDAPVRPRDRGCEGACAGREGDLGAQDLEQSARVERLAIEVGEVFPNARELPTRGLDTRELVAGVRGRIRKPHRVEPDELVAWPPAPFEDVLDGAEIARLDHVETELLFDLPDGGSRTQLAELDRAARRPISRHVPDRIGHREDEELVPPLDDREREPANTTGHRRLCCFDGCPRVHVFGVLVWCAVSRWYADASARSSGSLNGGPTSCSPTGSPSVPKPQGKKIAGTPARFPAGMSPMFPGRFVCGGLLAVVGG